jgi:hypothetical protein
LSNPSTDGRLSHVLNVEREMLATAILSLTDSERLVFTLYYYEELATEQLALMLNQTGGSISQIHDSALSHLHNRLACLEARTPESRKLSDLTCASTVGLDKCSISAELWLRAGSIQEIKIKLWRNDEPQDWSVEINGLLHEHVSIEILEDLVAAALIVAETWLTETTTNRQ